GKRLGGVEVVEEPCLFIEWQQGIVQVEAQIDSLFQRVAALGELCQGRQRLLKILYGFTVCRAREGLGASLPAVGECLVPHLAPQGVVGELLDVFGEAVSRELGDGFDDLGVEHTSPLLEQTTVGYLVGEGVLEGVFTLGEEPRLIEKLGRLQAGKAM